MENILKKITDYKWELPKSYKSGMRVPAYFYVSRKLMQILERDAVEQAANVATMPGIQKASLIMPDVHVGYGFPIGGVAAFDTDEGVVSPGGVGFDINCLAPGSKILTEHGYWINVEELPEKLEMQGIKVYNVNEGHNDSSEVAFVSEREIKNGEAAFRIITEGGRILESSGDHPILTSEGYKPAGKVSEGDYVIVYPFDGVEYEEKTETILTEEDLKKYDSQVLKYLRDRSLLPLRLDNPEIGTLARILGFAFGDGSLHWEVGNDKKRLILSFYGKKEELNEIRNDLMKIGVKASRIYTRKRKVSMKTPWDEYESKCTEAMIKVTSKAFALLMHRLGMPVGKKGIQPYCVPEWVRNAPKWVKRNFLAGLFGADGSVVFFKKHTPLPISLTQRRSIEFRENLLEFLGDIAEMLKEFRVNSIIYKIKSLDGKITYRLSIAGEENIKHFLGQINYEYSSDKKTRGLLGYEYLRRKEEVKKIRRLAVEEAKKAYLDNKSPSKAYEAVKGEYINRRLVERGLYENPVEIRIS
ncbi:MAG TPA: RNA-splicing ligase RtcB, partial [Archaeoglobaceae archaeon]|nr:RNA-splicing ligase RtcB [Archaeoglobaceae archaeon]